MEFCTDLSPINCSYSHHSGLKVEKITPNKYSVVHFYVIYDFAKKGKVMISIMLVIILMRDLDKSEEMTFSQSKKAVYLRSDTWT